MRWPHSLRSLSHRNLRLFFAGQCVSLTGTWMQSVGQGWLVYRLTHSSELLGVIGFLAQLPVFVFGVYAGSVADRHPRRKVVLATQINATLQAAIMAVLTLTGVVRPWHLMPLALMLGMSYAFEIPARQALLGEIAGESMSNAVALNSSIVNAARVVGPAIAGYVVAAIGEGWCFALNALSFLGTIWALLVMELPKEEPRPAAHRGAHLLEGLAYAGKTPLVRALLALLAFQSFFAMPFLTLLPLFAGDVLHGGPRMLGSLQAATGVGALVAAVLLMLRTGLRGLGRRVGFGATLLGLGLVAFSQSRTPALSLAALVVAGFGFISQSTGSLTLLQGLAPAEMRGRVMGLFSTIFVGLTPFGSLLGGLAAGRFGAPRTLLVGGLMLAAASAVFHLALPRLRRTVLPQHPTVFPPAIP
ncbi:MFS transporter [Anaeromyxobacter paludicola]|uniref:MFS transporter n=1 Tax=Anaeromyxobacter paludicola TaxID=2918171 RepID=A0ABN6N8U6_9BACT|nr:MFS transporter [Anaeromyxobacter paludicola]BDG08415.1 MFS transporter [Anaeromyxobacter paludicola]